MRYEIPFVWFGYSAKNAGLIPYTSRSDATWLALDAKTDEAAYAIVCNVFPDRRKRPISGRSHVRRWRAANVTLVNGLAPLTGLADYKVGNRVVLHAPHVAAATENGRGFRHGVIDECLGGYRYGIRLDGYPHIVDFHIREFASDFNGGHLVV